ncbi:hypothetical protein K2Z84_33940 [Candidatus Binatia bacterium]|nr:hypothetical protein [Candidatus Binatia bacterium]
MARATGTDVRPAGERGIALLAAVLILALLAAVTAATLWLVRSELWVAGSARALVQARYSAEAGAWHALAKIAPGTTFASLVAGTGGLADATDPGPLPFGGGGFVAFPGAPFGYAVTVHAIDAERVRLRATATSVRGARRTVDATIGRESAAYAPAALVVTSGAVAIAPALSGLAPESGGILVDATMPMDGGQAIVAATTPDAASAVWSSLAASAATLAGRDRRALARGFDVAAFASTSTLVRERAEDLASARGTVASPAAVYLGAGTAPLLQGAGVVLVGGDLVVDGPVDWRGVVYVAGELHLRGPSCRIDGMLWVRALRLTTGCALRFDRSALSAADGVLRLPRRPTLLALDDA